MVSGKIFLLYSSQIFQRWLIINDEQTAILCVDSYALNGNTTKHLITGSQNGNIDVYQINIQDELNKAKMIFRHVRFFSSLLIYCKVLINLCLLELS